jgi:hypothetical protein
VHPCYEKLCSVIYEKLCIVIYRLHQYIPTISCTLRVLRNNKCNAQIPYAQFLFSVLDYFGLLYTVAHWGLYDKFDSKNFVKFLTSEYFPSKDHCKASILWFVRNGLIHQIFPKATGIGISTEDSLFFRNVSNGNIPILNIDYLDRKVNEAIGKFIDDLYTNTIY